MIDPDAALDELLDRIPILQDRTAVEELPGGLTNRNLAVTTPAGKFVVRTSASDPGLLGIDREAEVENTRLAASAGVGAPVFDHRPGALTIGFLPGRALTDELFADAGVLHRAADAVRRLHASPRFVNDFDMFARQAAYRETVRREGITIPATYDDHAHAWNRVRQALAARPPETVPCNNDLLAGNFIDDGDRVWLIDYEYSGNNDRWFELGNTTTECEFTAEMTEAWTAAYLEAPTRGDLARVRLGALRSQYGWSLWGFIQAASSPIDFDFWSWGLHRFEKAARMFTSQEFDPLLAEAAGE